MPSAGADQQFGSLHIWGVPAGRALRVTAAARWDTGAGCLTHLQQKPLLPLTHGRGGSGTVTGIQSSQGASSEGHATGSAQGHTVPFPGSTSTPLLTPGSCLRCQQPSTKEMLPCHQPAPLPSHFLHTKAWMMTEPLPFAFLCCYHHFYIRLPRDSKVSWIKGQSDLSISPIQAQTHPSHTALAGELGSCWGRADSTAAPGRLWKSPGMPQLWPK